MKKNVLLILILIFYLDSFGQIAKDAVIISLSGNYMKTNTESGVQSNNFSTNGQYLNLGSSIGIFLSDHFVMGIGLNYKWGKEKRGNMFFNDHNIQIEKMEIKSKVLLPGVFFGYYFPILSKFYFNANLGLNCGKINSVYQRVYMESHNYVNVDTTGFNSPSLNSGSSASSSTIFSAQIYPELSYFLSSKFSLCLGLGGIEYSLTDWKFENSECAVNFNPAYWKLGVKFLITGT